MYCRTAAKITPIWRKRASQLGVGRRATTLRHYPCVDRCDLPRKAHRSQFFDHIRAILATPNHATTMCSTWWLPNKFAPRGSFKTETESNQSSTLPRRISDQADLPAPLQKPTLGLAGPSGPLRGTRSLGLPRWGAPGAPVGPPGPNIIYSHAARALLGHRRGPQWPPQAAHWGPRGAPVGAPKVI